MRKLFSFTNQVKSISLLILGIFILFYPAKTQSQSSNHFFAQNQYDPKTNYPPTFLNPQTVSASWENIQSVVISQPVSQVGPFVQAKPVGLNLDQVRNGSGASPVIPPAPAPWVNGNAGASNAHYAEGWSIPYRMVIDNLPNNGPRSVDIEWDTRQSNASAIDFVTNFDVLDYLPGSHVNNFGHPQEVINPLTSDIIGTTITYSGVIPTPDLSAAPSAVLTYYNAIMTYSHASTDANKFTIINGTITGFAYLAQGSVTATNASTSLRIFFTNESSTVIISWGGHIAKGPGVWGAGNSASAVSGSPYHTRILAWDPDGAGPGATVSVGNQDRSLSADAVLDPPQCSPSGPSPVECNTVNTYFSGVSASDLTGGTTFQWVLTGTNTAGATIVDGTHVDYATVNSGSGCGDKGYTIRFRLLKNGTELSHCDAGVTVQDTQAPTLTCAPVPTSPINCPASPVFGTATASDACGLQTLTFSDATTPGSCSGNYTVTRTWTASDFCGNTATCSRFVVVQDLTAPVISGVGSSSSVSCPGTPSFSNPTASDACGTSSLTFSDATTAGSCTNSYSVKRTWTATDACGNTSTNSQTITVTDNTAPVISGVGGPSSISCPATPSFSSPTASDACGTSSLTFSDATTAGTCANNYSVKRTWTATDACGNTSTNSQTITVTDNTAPVISGVGGPSTISCPAAPSFSSPTASDACGTASLTFSDATTPGTCANNYSVKRTWTATDACGKTSTNSQTITVVDNTPPTISCPADVTVECSVSTNPGDPAVGSATASDACGTPTVTSSDAPNTVGCVTVIARTWRAVDACGNTATCVQHITKRDRTPPAITCPQPFGTATATDNCTLQADIVIYYHDDGTTRIWTAIDGSGNISTCSNTVPAPGARIISNAIQETQTEVYTAPITIKAYPNPFNDRVKFVVTTTQAGYGTLDVMNMLGQKIKTVYAGQIPAGTQSFEMSLPASHFSTLFYILRMNGKQVTGKLIQAGY